MRKKPRELPVWCEPSCVHRQTKGRVYSRLAGIASRQKQNGDQPVRSWVGMNSYDHDSLAQEGLLFWIQRRIDKGSRVWWITEKGRALMKKYGEELEAYHTALRADPHRKQNLKKGKKYGTHP